LDADRLEAFCSTCVPFALNSQLLGQVRHRDDAAMVRALSQRVQVRPVDRWNISNMLFEKPNCQEAIGLLIP
jgi:hypothetical protein